MTDQRKPFRSKRARILLGLIGAMVLAAGIFALQASRMKAHAVEHAATGRAAGKLLAELSEGLKELNVPRILDCYSAGFAQTSGGDWREEQLPREDSLTVYQWRSDPGKSMTPDDLKNWWSGFIDGLDKVHLAKFKLADLEATADGEQLARIKAAFWLRANRKSGETFETQIKFRLTLNGSIEQPRIASQELLSGSTVIGAGNRLHQHRGRSRAGRL